MDSGGMSESDIRFINMRQKDALYGENAALRTQLAAALTEAEALRAFRDDALKQVREWDAQRAAGQAREVALRKLAAYMAEDVCQCDENLGTQCASCFARDYLSAPTDTAALRAMLRAAWIDGIDGDDGSNSADAYIDRVLGGS